MKIRILAGSVAAILLAILLFVACQKSDLNKKRFDSFDVAAAREWWYGSFRKSGEYRSIDRSSPFAPPSQSTGKKFPLWNRAISYTIGGLQMVELPLVYETSKILMPGMQHLNNTPEGERIARASTHKLVLLKKPDGSIWVRTVTIVPAPGYAKMMHYDIGAVSPNNLPVEFSGFLMVSGWDESSVNIVRIDGGKPSRKLKIVTGKTLDSLEASGRILSREVCNPVWVPEMVWVCVVVPTGDAIADQERCQENGHWTESGAWSFELQCYEVPDEDPEDPCTLYGIGCDGENGGGEEGDPLPEISNEVDDPCMRNSVNNAISLDCRNKITAFVNNVFANSDQFHLFFYDNILQGNQSGLDAYTSSTPLADLTQIKTTITFNNGQLGNASQEYIASTILHEVLHAWIDYTYPAPVDNANQHNLMADSYRFNLMRDALREMFPTLSLQDAADLTWGGMGGTILFSNLPPEERNRILDKNRDFKNGTLGTPC